MIQEFLRQLSKNNFKIINTKKGKEVKFRCPICGDSKKNRYKSRFYYNLTKNEYFCFNCSNKGTIRTLIDKFNDLPNVDYINLRKYITDQVIDDFINEKTEIVSNEKRSKCEIKFPDGALLDLILTDNIQYLTKNDKLNLLKVISYLKSRQIKKNWFKYFYFPFAGEEYDNYILTLFKFKDDWIWSARKVWGAGDKYLHVKDFLLNEALAFENEIDKSKGDDLYIVEGWFSALSLNQNGYNSVCVFGLNSMSFDHSPLQKYKKDYNLIWLPDIDKSFLDFLKINKNQKFTNEEQMFIKILPEKDVNDMEILYKDKFKKEFDKIQPISLSEFKLKNQLNYLTS